jgi:hypothetical protein
MPITKTLTFSFVVEEQEGAYVAHCLETGLVATAKDESDVVAKMSKLLDRQVKFAIKHNRLADIYHSAPRNVIAKFLDMSERVISTTQKPIQSSARRNLTINETAYAAAC